MMNVNNRDEALKLTKELKGKVFILMMKAW